MTCKVTTIEDVVFDVLDDIAFRLQFSTDEELVRVVTRLVNRGTDHIHAVVKFAERHGGTLVAVRVARLLRTHGPTGSGKRLWNRASGNRLVLVEGSNA